LQANETKISNKWAVWLGEHFTFLLFYPKLGWYPKRPKVNLWQLLWLYFLQARRLSCHQINSISCTLKTHKMRQTLKKALCIRCLPLRTIGSS